MVHYCSVSILMDRIVDRLRQADVVLERGLSEAEFERIEHDYEFGFSSVHREFLATVLPLGGGWCDWRHGVRDEFSQAWQLGGVLFDVEHNVFWPRSWGPRPADLEAALQVASARLAQVPPLIRLHGHRFLAADIPGPVFSVHQTDVVYYGDNLLDYIANEFHVGPRHPTDRPHVPFWSDLADGLESDDL